MILRSSPASPFARKVRIAADLLGLADRLSVRDADTTDPDGDIRRQNPLGKIPTLVLDDGRAIYDSSVIVDYLDDLAGGGSLIPAAPERFAVLTHQALADGLMEASLLQVYEGRFRAPDRHEPRWIEHQGEKVRRALDSLSAEPGLVEGRPVHIGHVAQACALGYLDLRFAGEWRRTHPGLVGWLDAFAARVPAFERTRAPS